MQQHLNHTLFIITLLTPVVAPIDMDSTPSARHYKRKCAKVETKSENHDAKYMTGARVCQFVGNISKAAGRLVHGIYGIHLTYTTYVVDGLLNMLPLTLKKAWRNCHENSILFVTTPVGVNVKVNVNHPSCHRTFVSPASSTH